MKQSRERANERTEQEERTRAKDAPLASPVPRLSSVPSDVFTVHTIASRSPLRPLVSTLRERDGRPPRPVQGDAIATPRHHIASEQQPQGIASTFCHPPRLFLVLVLFLQVVRKGRAKEQTEQEEKEPGRRMPPTSSPVPLFCLLPSPSTPSPVLPFRLRLRFLLFFALISSARSHLFALPSSCSSFLALLPAY